MGATKDRISRFRAEIRKIIAEIEAYIGVDRGSNDSEFSFQRQAFEERCDQAKDLARSLSSDSSGESRTLWSLRDGDAHRIHESLKLSLDYFRRDHEH